MVALIDDHSTYFHGMSAYHGIQTAIVKLNQFKPVFGQQSAATLTVNYNSIQQ